MSDPHPTRRTGAGRTPPRLREAASFPARVPLILTALLLLCIILVHAVVDDRADDIRGRLSGTVLPARAAVLSFHAEIASQTAALRGYLLTGDRDFLERYGDAVEAERRYRERLATLAAMLGGDWHDRVRRLERESAAWHARIARAGLLAEPPPAAVGRRLLLDPFAHRRLSDAAEDLDRDLARVESALWSRLEMTTRVDLALSVALVLLALCMIGFIAWTGRRTQRLSTYLARRAEEERVFRELARDLAAATSAGELAERLADGARSLTHSVAVYIERVLPGRQWVTVTVADGVDAPRPGERTAYADSLTKRLAERDEPEYFASLDQLRAPLASSLAGAHRNGGVLALPLVADAQALGALVLVRGTGQRPFDPVEVARIRIVGEYASLALFRVLLLQEARQREAQEAQHAEEAERQRHEVEQLMRGKAGFIRGFSHDLKNPLGAILGYAEILEGGYKGELTPDQKESVHRIGQAARSALKLIQDLVDLSRAEAGQLEIERAPADIAPVLRDAAEEYRAQTEAAGLRFEVRIPSELPEACADADRVRQVLGNLLSNAVKYTAEGGRIWISAGERSGVVRGRRGRWVVVDVADTGPGIAPEDQERIFQEFTRIRPAGQAGAGLGLAISRRIARLMDGDVTLRSEVGRGSTFTLWLPLAAEAAGGRAA